MATVMSRSFAENIVVQTQCFLETHPREDLTFFTSVTIMGRRDPYPLGAYLKMLFEAQAINDTDRKLLEDKIQKLDALKVTHALVEANTLALQNQEPVVSPFPELTRGPKAPRPRVVRRRPIGAQPDKNYRVPPHIKSNGAGTAQPAQARQTGPRGPTPRTPRTNSPKSGKGNISPAHMAARDWYRQCYLKFGSQGIVYGLQAIRQQEAEVGNNTRKKISASIEVPGQGPIHTKELLTKIPLLVRANDVDPRTCEPIGEFANIMRAALESRQQSRSNARPESGR